MFAALKTPENVGSRPVADIRGAGSNDRFTAVRYKGSLPLPRSWHGGGQHTAQRVSSAAAQRSARTTGWARRRGRPFLRVIEEIAERKALAPDTCQLKAILALNVTSQGFYFQSIWHPLARIQEPVDAKDLVMRTELLSMLLAEAEGCHEHR